MYNMLSSNIASMEYLVSQAPSPFPNYPTIANNISQFDFNNFLFSEPENSEDNQANIIDERKQRRIVSNRESARRSRMRKQRQLDELWGQVVQLKSENRHLIDRLNNLFVSHDKVLLENKTLKEEVFRLKKIVTELQLGNMFCALDELEEVTCNADCLRDEFSE